MEQTRNIKQDNYILYAIILVAIILRFISPFDIPYTYDEHSALIRTHFSTFSELIENGVKPDGHPAGIQVFLYYWTKLFGYSELVVKLPFIVFGILSVLLIYKIAQKWFNSTVGLVCAAFIASLQYTVMYSQIARPYISGLFFSLLMVYFWTKVVSNPQKRVYVNGIFYIIASILCAYNHYFSLLFAMIVGFTGLFVIDRKYIKWYILFGVIIFLAFIPHLNIFLYQLRMGGVEGWLSKPHNDFLLEYIKYLFHYSPFVLILVLGIVIFGIVKCKKEVINSKYLLIAFCWFILPFLIGFIYSKYINSVLQFSVLIFSFPFLLLLIFGCLPEITYKQKWIIVSLILIVTSLSLIFERKHYTIFYNSPFEQILIQHDSIKKTNADYVSIIDSERGISKYYINKNDLDTSFVWYDSFTTVKEFIHFLDKQEKSNLYFGCLSGSNPPLVPIIMDYYPYIEWQKDYFGGTAYYFSKKKKGSIEQPIFSSIMGFEEEQKNWSLDFKQNRVDYMSFQGKYSFLLDSTQESSPSFSIRLDEVMKNENNFIDISLYTLCVDFPEEVLLTSSLESNGKNIDWRAAFFDAYVSMEDVNKTWIKIHHTIKLSDIYLNYSNINLRVNVWNKGRKKLFIDKFEIKTRKGNSIIYGTVEDF